MSTALLERRLASLADVAIKVVLNLQPDQRLLIIGPLMIGGVSLEAAALVREIAASAYRAGARLVEAIWGDELLHLVRFRTARAETLSASSAWLPHVLIHHVSTGGAVLSVHANDPGLLEHERPELVEALRDATSNGFEGFRGQKRRNQTNWGIIGAPGDGWAAKVFPEVPPEERTARLWDAIADVCRLDLPDPIAAWQQHLTVLAARRDYLNDRRYTAVRFVGPGTDVTVGLPDGHLWVTAALTSQSGIRFVPNIPTEEVFTIADRNRVSGHVRATKPLVLGGTVLEGFSFRFEDGRIVDLSASRGESVLRRLVATNPSAGRLGEVALVPHSSPVSRSGRLFYNTLFDENAASHLALGAAYRFTLTGADAMSDEEFERAGGNGGAIHVDFMIGSDRLDVDGILRNGSTEAVIRGGEWAAHE